MICANVFSYTPLIKICVYPLSSVQASVHALYTILIFTVKISQLELTLFQLKKSLDALQRVFNSIFFAHISHAIVLKVLQTHVAT